jgi:hypothetical protein
MYWPSLAALCTTLFAHQRSTSIAIAISDVAEDVVRSGKCIHQGVLPSERHLQLLHANAFLWFCRYFKACAAGNIL